MKTLFFTLLIFGLTTANAQQSSTESHHYFGARAGAIFAHPNFAKGSPPLDYKTTWGPGFSAGFFLNVPLFQKLFIQPEYLFTQMNSEISDPETNLKFNYLSLPVLLKYQLSKKLSILAGPQFDLLISSESETPEKTTDMTHYTEERSLFATFGLEYNLLKSLSIGARYMQGLNHIGLGQNNTTEEFKFEAVQITASFGF